MISYHNLFKSFQRSYMLMIPLSVILQSCLGSIATMYVMINKPPTLLLQMAISIIISMAYNAAILAQLKVKLVFNLLVISLFGNMMLLLLNLL